MKNTILAATAAATLLGACEVDDKYYGKEVVDPAEKLEPAYGEDCPPMPTRSTRS